MRPAYIRSSGLDGTLSVLRFCRLQEFMRGIEDQMTNEEDVLRKTSIVDSAVINTGIITEFRDEH